MIWERALEADARLAARNAVKIRAAIAQSFDAKRVFEQYLSTQPAVSNKPAQDRARARAWVMLNVRVNMQPLKEVMLRVWAEGYVTGDAFAEEQVAMARVAQKADDGSYIDWDSWRPGDQASALLLRPPKAFQQLLQMQSITFKDFSDTTVRDIGNAVADAIELGMNAQRSAKNIARHVANPARALSIAITEQNRAISYATLNRYKESEIEKVEWQTSSPCDKCAQNQGQVVAMGATFNSGGTQPPVHPHCRCVLLPVIPDFDEEDATPTGTTLITPPAPPVLPPAFPTPKQQIEQTVAELQNRTITPGQAIYEKLDSRPFIPGQWEVVPKEAMLEVELSNIIRSRTTKIDRARAAVIYDIHAKKMDRDFVAKGVVYKNGPIEVQFGGVGLGVKDEIRKQVIEEVEKLQISNPKNRAVVHITKDSKNKYGWAYLGQEDLWVVPKIVKDTELKVNGAGGFKMPVTPTTTQFQYTLAHEWGHIVDDLSPGSISRQSARTTEVITKLKKEFPDAFKSRYSAENSKEFYAEMFTEYYRTSGATPNPLVQAMATEFGWKVPGGVVQPKLMPTVAPTTTAQPKKVVAKYKDQDSFDKEEILKILDIKENQIGMVTIWNGATGRYEEAFKYTGDDRLKAILQAQGFTAKPTVLGATDFAVLEQLGTPIIHRGLTASATKSVDDMIKEFKDGEMFVGTGVAGNGVYAGTNLDYVIKYAGDNPDNVMTMALSPTAKVIDIEDAKKGANAVSNAFYDKAFKRQYRDPELGKFVDSFGDLTEEQARNMGVLFRDPGRYAALNGYDAMKHVDDDGGVYIILNRGAVRVKE
jgi:SPP1 gp7 family putative phage head morphogenesis protein